MRHQVDIPVPAKIQEHHLQCAVVQRLRRMGVDVASDQNAAKRHPVLALKLKAAGMVAGEPDLRIYMPGGRAGFIEMKLGRARPSPAQVERIEKLRSLGYPVAVINASTMEDAADQAEAIVREWLGASGQADKV